MAKKAKRRRPPKQKPVPTSPLWKRPWVLVALVVLLMVLLLLVPTFSDGRPVFDGERAYDEVVRQVAFGPRVPGTDAHDAARAYFVETLEALADRVLQQPVTATIGDSVAVEGTNIVASFNLAPK